jgi:hypothetical protein
MQRGYNSHIYYTEKGGNGNDCVINELKCQVVSQKWTTIATEIYKINDGRIIALEMDSENREMTDSIYTYNNKLIETQAAALNKFYILDDKENLICLRQKAENESGTRYEII